MVDFVFKMKVEAVQADNLLIAPVLRFFMSNTVDLELHLGRYLWLTLKLLEDFKSVRSKFRFKNELKYFGGHKTDQGPPPFLWCPSNES